MAPQFDDDWANAQTNRPLANEHTAGYAYAASFDADVLFHQERWKNWDNYLAVYHACRGSDGFAAGARREVPVLDAGACRDPKSPSSFLPTLSSYGFNRLYGCNLDEPAEGAREGGITYERADITRTHYRDEMFGFAACLSTIEHGVNEFDFLDEMYRVLKPGGELFFSFDYWRDHIDTGGRMAFGVPVRIFSAADVAAMIEYAENIGFELTHDVAMPVDGVEPVVKWLGLEYTFMNLLLRKRVIKVSGC